MTALALQTNKWCPHCSRDLSTHAFGVNRAKGDGLQSWCRDCMRPTVQAAKRRYKIMPGMSASTVVEGFGRMTNCPRCSQLLYEEPAMYRCRWGCGRLFLKQGASFVDQMNFERVSGLYAVSETL